MSIHLENPVLHKELAHRFQLRRQTKANRIAIYVILGMIIPLLYYFSIRGLYNTDSSHHDAYTIFLIGVETSLVVLLTPAMLAGSITLEREKQTWNALLLSRLTHAEIVLGKFVGGIVPALVMLSIFFPLNVMAAIRGGVSLQQFALSHLLLLATMLFYGAIGLFCSWACRRTQVATAVSAGVIATLVLGTYLAFALWQMVVGYQSYGHPMELSFVPLWANPYFAMNCLLDNGGTYDNIGIGVMNAFFALGGTALLLFLVTRRLGGGPKEMSA